MLKNISISKILNNILLLLLAFCIVYSILLCGSPLKNNISGASILLNLLAITSILIYTFIYKKKLSLNKYDILFACFGFMYLIPIVFQTYSSISDTIEYFLRYISIFCVYLILKHLNFNQKTVSILVHSIILGVLFTIFLGIDDMSTCFFTPIHQILGTYTTPFSSTTRLDSVFQYPNAFASTIIFSCILTLGLFLKTEKNSLKGLYAGLVQLQMIALILSGSRLNIFIFLMVLLVFLLFLKNKRDVFDILKLFFVLSFTTLFYCTNYLNWINQHAYLFVWSFLLLAFFLIYLIQIVFLNKNRLNINFSTKNLFFISITILSLGILLFLVLLQIPDSLTLFHTKTSKKSVTIKQIDAIKPNTSYTFEFNIEATNSKQSLPDNYRIMIFELNDSLENLRVHTISFSDFNGIKTYSFSTLANTSILKIACKTRVLDENTKLTIYDCSMNQTKLLINYKYLPTDFIFRISKIFSGDNSLQERFVFIKDGISIGLQHFFTGNGANGWLYNFADVQTSDYYTTEVHSYPIQLFIEIGIIGIFLLLLLWITLGIDFFHFLRKNQVDVITLSCMCALLSLLLHSSIDFEMSFFSVLLLYYTMISILVHTFYSTLEKKETKKYPIGISFLLLIVLVYCLCLNMGSLLSKRIEKGDVSSLELSKKVLFLNPYDKNARYTKISSQLNLPSDINVEDFELFFQYEPKWYNINDLKISYIKKLLNEITPQNIDESISNIQKVSFGTLSSNEKKEILTILELIREKTSLYPTNSFSSLYNQFSKLLNE